MRISETKLVQFIDSEPPRLILIDEELGVEVYLTPAEVDVLRDRALPYFHPYMHRMFKVPKSEN